MDKLKKKKIYESNLGLLSSWLLVKTQPIFKHMFGFGQMGDDRIKVNDSGNSYLSFSFTLGHALT